MLSLFEPGNEAAWLASFAFGVDVRPRYCECDGQGHVSNVVYAEYLELSRLRFFAAAGDPEPGDFAFQHVTAELQLRYLAACYYDEPLRVLSRLTALGRSSATLEQAIVGAGAILRATARVALVRSNGSVALPWTTAQREALNAFGSGLAASALERAV
ncbi:MAG: acyl-CoA thioesterase [Candidatus Eremiobacteraeota bacterium]|nr:acyl-CoA thioesterase [Candidatus Eremiobacteraeota bacterium]